MAAARKKSGSSGRKSPRNRAPQSNTVDERPTLHQEAPTSEMATNHNLDYLDSQLHTAGIPAAGQVITNGAAWCLTANGPLAANGPPVANGPLANITHQDGPPTAPAAGPDSDLDNPAALENQFAFDLAADPTLDVATLMRQMQHLQAQFMAFTAPPTTPGADPMTNATGRRLVVPTLSEAPDSVPKPKGSAGGGQRGYHLKAAMGLTGSDSDGLYNMILATVRELVHAARIDLSRPYHQVSPESLSRVFASARRMHPYLARFERDWATAAIVKQYMSSARRYGRRKNYFSSVGNLGERRNLDDM
ncbi:hypothetical protein BDY19DRAFT_910818 [Irpex rosettiformis]|uniref:Uncharacterized protein n=1 Tax=Irpex rosettiformis TaxID=378272 RepID=A0ACB8TM85_9APHY|nr:hypothetical protein BDY19DRAFT_910818 [Irpex rosettiformis]